MLHNTASFQYLVLVGVISKEQISFRIIINLINYGLNWTRPLQLSSRHRLDFYRTFPFQNILWFDFRSGLSQVGHVFTGNLCVTVTLWRHDPAKFESSGMKYLGVMHFLVCHIGCSIDIGSSQGIGISRCIGISYSFGLGIIIGVIMQNFSLSAWKTWELCVF